MQWTLTLIDPLGLVPPIDLNRFTDNGYQQVVLFPDITGSNNAGVPIFSGAAGNYQLSWLLGLSLSTDAVLRLKNMYRLQFSRRYLILEDQFQELPPEPFPHSRTLITGTQRTIDDAVTGCGRVAVSMAIKSDASGNHIGNAIGSGGGVQAVFITLVENVNIRA